MDHDIATRTVTAFNTFDELLLACSDGYVPTIFPALKVHAYDELGRYVGYIFDLDSQVREFLRTELRTCGHKVWPEQGYTEVPAPWMP